MLDSKQHGNADYYTYKNLESEVMGKDFEDKLLELHLMRCTPLNGNTCKLQLCSVEILNFYFAKNCHIQTCVCASACGLVCANCWRVHICVVSEGVHVVRLMEAEVIGQG